MSPTKGGIFDATVISSYILRATPSAAGPLCDWPTVGLHDRQDLQNWQDLKTCCCSFSSWGHIFETSGHHFCLFLRLRVIIFAIQGSTGPAKRIHKDPGFDFHRFLTDFGIFFRSCFGAVGSLLRDLRDTNSSIGFQVAF